MDQPAGPRLALREKLYLLDYALVGLALASFVLFAFDRASALAGAETRVVRFVDVGISVAYALIFVAKWTLAPSPSRWFRGHFLLLPAIVPLTVPVLVGDPWHLVHQIGILALRVGKAIDRLFGAHVMAALSQRYRAMVLEEMTEPLLMRLAVLLEQSVTSRDYAAAIGKRLDERRDLVEAAVARGIRASPKLSRVVKFGPVQRVVDETTREVVDAAHAALTGPEINTIIREAFRDAFAELKGGIEERKWQRTGVGFSDVAHGVAEGAARFIHAHEPVPAAPLVRT